MISLYEDRGPGKRQDQRPTNPTKEQRAGKLCVLSRSSLKTWMSHSVLPFSHPEHGCDGPGALGERGRWNEDGNGPRTPALVSVGRQANTNGHHYFSFLLEKIKCLICSRLCIQLFVAKNIPDTTCTKNFSVLHFKWCNCLH